MRRIALFGGSFDPIHFGHLAIAEEARWLLAFEQVYLVPTATQPLKSKHQGASPAQRLEMVRRACHDNPALTPSDIEIRRSGLSFTVDTLTELHQTLRPDDQLWFILGADALMELPRWYRADEIIKLAHLAAVARPGTSINLQTLDTTLPGIATRTTLIEGPKLDISSSNLRARIARGAPVRYQIPDPVIAYIHEHGLYKTPPS